MPSKTKKKEEDRRMPSWNEQVVVDCGRFRCVAFLATDGNWYRLSSGKELAGVKSWMPLDGNKMIPVSDPF